MTRLAALSLLLMTSCAHLPGIAACSASSVLAVVESVQSGAPSSVGDAAACWLDLWGRSHEEKPDHVRALEAAVMSGVDASQVLLDADEASPEVCRP